MKRTGKFPLLLLILFSYFTKAQLSGIYNVPATYSTIGAAINALNTQGVSGPVVINVAAGHTETVITGGYNLIASGTNINTITFQKNGVGPNPLITAYTGGVSTSSTNIQDGVWRLIGSDYITIDGIDILDPNTTNPATMEYGFGLFKSSPVNGCQNNVIKNCTITLNKINNTSSATSGPSTAGSRGIVVVNSTSTSHTVDITVTSAAGSNSFNKFYSNTIQNCHTGISLYGHGFSGMNMNFADQANDIGGNSILTGNTIINFGGAPNSSSASHAIKAFSQADLNISFNSINNNNGGGTNHTFSVSAIQAVCFASSQQAILNNTISVNSNADYYDNAAIEFTGSTFTTGAINVSNNLITNCVNTSTNPGTFYGISFRYGPSNANISNNVITNHTVAATTNTYYCIYSWFGGENLNINNNSISNINFTAPSTSCRFYGIYNLGAVTPTAVCSVSSNSIQNIAYSGTASANFEFISNNSISSTINNNRLISLTIPTSGDLYMISTPAEGTMNISGNSIGTLSKTQAGGIVAGLYNNTFITGTSSINNNNFSNVTVTGNTSYYGIYSWFPTNQQQKFIVTSNTVSVITCDSAGSVTAFFIPSTIKECVLSKNLVHTITGGAIAGIFVTASISTVHSNTLHSMQTVNGITGISIGSYTLANVTVRNNRIYNLKTNGLYTGVCGISINSSGNSSEVYNNLIGDLHAPFSSSQDAIIGLYAGGSSMVNIFFNTIFLSTTTASGSLGSSAIKPFAWSQFKLKNNILINTSVIGNGGFACVLNSAFSSGYHLSSNNNMFSVGTPGPSRYIDAFITPGTFSIFKTFVSPRESNSVNELPVFVSTNGAHPFFLKLVQNIPTLAESGAVPIAGITTDYPETIRNTSTPDIGAWEDYYAPLDQIAPTITGVAKVSGYCNLSSITVTANIIDASGVASGSLLPRCYFKINNGAYSSVQGSLTSGSSTNGTWTFTLAYSAVPGNTLSYYVTAQDINGPANVGASPPSGFAATNVNTITTNPTTTYTESITGVLNGTYTVGIGGSFTTLTSAAAAWNTWCITGPVTFLLNDPSYSTTETFPIVFKNNPDASNTNSLFIQPNAGLPVVITGSATAVLKFLDSRYITVNGSNSGSSLTMVNTNTLTSTVIWIASTNTVNSGNRKICIQNSNLQGGAYNAADIWGILAGMEQPLPVSGIGQDNDSISILNNTILRVKYGILCVGNGSVVAGGVENIRIKNNIIGPPGSGTNNIGGYGMYLYGLISSEVKDNIIQNITTNVADMHGLIVEQANIISVSGNTISALTSSASGFPFSGMKLIGPYFFNGTIIKNVISNINGLTGSGARGLTVFTGTNNLSNVIQNNMISVIHSYASLNPPNMIIGLALESGKWDVENNSIHLSGTYNTALTSTNASAAIYVNFPVQNCKLRNNIFSNIYDDIGPFKHIAYSIYSNASPSVFPVMNYNNYYVGGGADSLVLSHVNNLQQFNLTSLQGAWGNNVNSLNVAPVFFSPNDLHLTQANTSINNIGVPILSVTNDIDNDPRNTSTPDIGADEFFTSNCSPVTGGNQGITTYNVCNGQTVQLNCSGGIGSGLIYQWKISNTPGGPYTNVSGGSGTTTSFTSTPLSTGTYYFIMETMCPLSSISATSNEATVTVNSVPTASFSTNLPICLGQTLNLNGSSNIGTQFYWTGPNSFTSSLQNPQINPAGTINSGVYNLTVTQGPCQSSYSSSVSFITPTLAASNAGPYCTGGVIQLNTYPAQSYTWTGPSAYLSTLQNPFIASANVSMAGTYSLISDLGPCTSSAITTVSVSTSPTVSISASQSIICVGQSAILSASGATGYWWNTGSTSFSLQVTPTVTTIYTVTGTSFVYCNDNEVFTLSVSPCTGFEKVKKDDGFFIYPNPNNGEFNIECYASENFSLIIMDLLGKIIHTENNVYQKGTVALRNSAKGVYLVKVFYGNTVEIKKLIIE